MYKTKATQNSQWESKLYSVLALGDSNYPRFCNCGRGFDKRFQELGCKRFYKRVDVDQVDDAVVNGWIDGVIAQLITLSQTLKSIKVPLLFFFSVPFNLPSKGKKKREKITFSMKIKLIESNDCMFSFQVKDDYLWEKLDEGASNPGNNFSRSRPYFATMIVRRIQYILNELSSFNITHYISIRK
jgi:hypothetical protein